MLAENPRKLILIGFVLVVLGVALPMLMVLDIIRTTFLMSLLAHGASVSGMFLGFLGTLMIVRYRKAEPLGERFQPSSWSDEPPPKR
ncbi:MAG: hypothetical protein MUQ30_21065 [Anaerolineae bacterium]|nr:hypothetical protein [Anaerolineae bacterium]